MSCCGTRTPFCDLIEAFDDLVARPRTRWWHSFHEGWDYGDFARVPGQALYRWKVNTLLDRSELDLGLATDGEDAGRLVHAICDQRTHLVSTVLATAAAADRAAAEHAIALQRARDASTEDRCSAIIALAGILESRRGLIHRRLSRKDEDALFGIANQFDLRHRDARQRRDYDPAFLDWLFWWYLATVELTDRLIARTQPNAHAG